MSQASSGVADGVEHRGIVWAVRLLAAIACGVAGYLAYQSLTGKTPSGCGEGGGCEDVLHSRWSTWLGIPVSLAAVAVYAGVLLASLGAVAQSIATRKRSWGALAALAASAGVAAAWFIALQFGPVGHICRYCMTVHACGLAILILVLVALRRTTPAARPARLSALLALGAAAPGILIAGQLLRPDQPQTLITYGGGGGGSATTSTAATTHAALPRFWLGKTAVEIDPRDVPLLGSPDARYPIAIMTDYTCPHCRAMHTLLAHVRQRYGAQVALLILPVPMDGRCNPRIKLTLPIHEHACEVSRLAMSVWRADPRAFAELDPWLFESSIARTPAEVRAKAISLIGDDRLRRAEADPWPDQMIRRAVDLYDQASGGQVPKLLLPKEMPPGNVSTEAQLFALLERELGIKPISTNR